MPLSVLPSLGRYCVRSASRCSYGQRTGSQVALADNSLGDERPGSPCSQGTLNPFLTGNAPGRLASLAQGFRGARVLED